MTTVLVTGASSGFGKLFVDEILRRNGNGRDWKVIAAIRGGETRGCAIFSDYASEIAVGTLSFIDLHMERRETFESARQAVEKKCSGRLDVLVNNAGYGLLGPVEVHTEADIRRQMEVNFFGPFFLTQMLLPFLRASKGRIINVSSIAGMLGMPFYGAYNASKHALEGLSEALYHELKPLGVQIALVEPGGFKTDFATRGYSLGAWEKRKDLPYHLQSEDFLNRYNQKNRGEKKMASNADPRVVAKLMADLCEMRKMPIRSVVGVDAKALWTLKRLLPERLRVWLLEWLFRNFVFSKKT